MTMVSFLTQLPFKDDSGKEITELDLLRPMNINTEYNRVLGFNNTIVTMPRENI